MIMAMLLQNFDFQLDDPACMLRIKQNLTIKPDNFKMKATLHHKMNARDLETVLRGKLDPGVTAPLMSNGIKPPAIPTSAPDLKSVTILYGSNTGTCQAFAQRMAIRVIPYGFRATVMDMNAAVNDLPKGQPVVIITANLRIMECNSSHG